LVYTDRAVENRIKERLTGALILVALLVVLVPELLSGRAPRQGGDAVPEARPASEGPPMVVYKLPMMAEPEAKTAGQSVLHVKAADADPPLPAPAPEAVPVPVPQVPQATPPAPVAPQVASISRPAPAVKAPTATGEKPVGVPAKGWTVQVGSFSRRENAQRYVQELGRKGYGAQVLGGGTLFRVRVGPVADRTEAAALQLRLSADGFKGAIAAP
jgi:DedD protein